MPKRSHDSRIRRILPVVLGGLVVFAGLGSVPGGLANHGDVLHPLFLNEAYAAHPIPNDRPGPVSLTLYIPWAPNPLSAPDLPGYEHVGVDVPSGDGGILSLASCPSNPAPETEAVDGSSCIPLNEDCGGSANSYCTIEDGSNGYSLAVELGATAISGLELTIHFTPDATGELEVAVWGQEWGHGPATTQVTYEGAPADSFQMLAGLSQPEETRDLPQVMMKGDNQTFFVTAYNGDEYLGLVTADAWTVADGSNCGEIVSTSSTPIVRFTAKNATSPPEGCELEATIASHDETVRSPPIHVLPGPGEGVDTACEALKDADEELGSLPPCGEGPSQETGPYSVHDTADLDSPVTWTLGVPLERKSIAIGSNPSKIEHHIGVSWSEGSPEGVVAVHLCPLADEEIEPLLTQACSPVELQRAPSCDDLDPVLTYCVQRPEDAEPAPENGIETWESLDALIRATLPNYPLSLRITLVLPQGSPGSAQVAQWSPLWISGLEPTGPDEVGYGSTSLDTLAVLADPWHPQELGDLPQVLTEDQSKNYSAVAFDEGGNRLGQVQASWSVSGGCGTVEPTVAIRAEFTATRSTLPDGDCALQAVAGSEQGAVSVEVLPEEGAIGPGDLPPQLTCADPEDFVVFLDYLASDADCDGYANESEIGAGCDPLDPQSNPGVPTTCNPNPDPTDVDGVQRWFVEHLPPFLNCAGSDHVEEFLLYLLSDADCNGNSNEEELQNGCNPFNPVSHPAFSSTCVQEPDTGDPEEWGNQTTQWLEQQTGWLTGAVLQWLPPWLVGIVFWVAEKVPEDS